MAADGPYGGLVGRSEGKGMIETLTCLLRELLYWEPEGGGALI